MKTKVNLTIEKNILDKAKACAEKTNESFSSIVEDYLEILAKPEKESFVTFIENLNIPKVSENINFKQEYYSEKPKNYGF